MAAKRAAGRTPCNPWDMRFPLCVGRMWDGTMFSSVCALPSPASAEGCCPSLFDWFTGVGSEEARSRAGFRPPLKLHVRFSRMQLSRKLSYAERQAKELAQPGSQARTRDKAPPWASVSSRHSASA